MQICGMDSVGLRNQSFSIVLERVALKRQCSDNYQLTPRWTIEHVDSDVWLHTDRHYWRSKRNWRDIRNFLADSRGNINSIVIKTEFFRDLGIIYHVRTCERYIRHKGNSWSTRARTSRRILHFLRLVSSRLATIMATDVKLFTLDEACHGCLVLLLKTTMKKDRTFELDACHFFLEGGGDSRSRVQFNDRKHAFSTETRYFLYSRVKLKVCWKKSL